jgi:hypothetical protein
LDTYTGDPNGIIEVPAGDSCADIVALKGDREIGEKINIIIAKLAEANDFKSVIDVADFNDPEKLFTGKEMVDRLSNLVAIFNCPELDFRKNRAESDDMAREVAQQPLPRLRGDGLCRRLPALHPAHSGGNPQGKPIGSRGTAYYLSARYTLAAKAAARFATSVSCCALNYMSK